MAVCKAAGLLAILLVGNVMRALRRSPLAALIDSLAPCAVDIGARGGFDEDMLPIGWASHMLGFEPEPEEALRLNETGDPRWKKTTILPFAVGGVGGASVLYVPESKEGASLLRHNAVMSERFGHENLHVTRAEIPVETITLDQLRDQSKLPRVDYLKIDIEGAELDVLKSARTVLRDCVALKVECSFLEQRIGQPLIWEVAVFLLKQGFEILDLHDVHRWRRRNLPSHPYRVKFEMPYSRGQVAQCDLVALRTPTSVTSADQALRLVILSAAFGYFDYAITTIRDRPDLQQVVKRRHGFDLELELQRWARVLGRRETRKEILAVLRRLVPLTRSLVGMLPFTQPKQAY